MAKKFCWEATGKESESDVIASMVVPTTKGNMLVGVALEGDIKDKVLDVINEHYNNIDSIFNVMEELTETKTEAGSGYKGILDTIPFIVGMSLIGLSIISFIVLIVLDLCSALF